MKKIKLVFLSFTGMYLIIFNSCKSPIEPDPIINKISSPPVITGIYCTGPDSPDILSVLGKPNGKSSIPDNHIFKGGSIPTSIRMLLPYPNPTTGSTSIVYSLPNKVEVSIWVVKGIAPDESIEDHSLYANGYFKVHSYTFSMNLYKGAREAGMYKYQWNGRDEKGNILPDGLYRIYIEINGDFMWQDVMIYHLAFSEEGSIPNLFN